MAFDQDIKTYSSLLPCAFLYGIGVRLRNQFFDWGWLKERSFPIPVISIGNLAVGGTGKTPHTEYLIRLLSDQYRVAVVSRGYKRKTKGYLLATANSTSKEIGDEPFQMKLKYPDLILAVDSNRCRAIDNLLALPSEERPHVILLDDAFQHRYVSPSYSILLTDFSRLYYKDKLLPAGRLREPSSGQNRASMVIVTKSPSVMKPIDCRVIETELNLLAYQALFFTHIQYGKVTPLFKDQAHMELFPLSKMKKEQTVLLVSGIANPTSFISKIERYTKQVSVMNFSDHHVFRKSDFKQIKETFDQLPSPDKIIIVTEKDAARLISEHHFPEELKPYIYYLPIEIQFNLENQYKFNELILEHIRNFKRNRIVTL